MIISRCENLWIATVKICVIRSSSFDSSANDRYKCDGDYKKKKNLIILWIRVRFEFHRKVYGVITPCSRAMRFSYFRCYFVQNITIYCYIVPTRYDGWRQYPHVAKIWNYQKRKDKIAANTVFAIRAVDTKRNHRRIGFLQKYSFHFRSPRIASGKRLKNRVPLRYDVRSLYDFNWRPRSVRLLKLNNDRCLLVISARFCDITSIIGNTRQ